MNSLPEDKALRNRIEVIKVDGYTHKDKIKIAINYLLPKIITNLNLDKYSITLSEEVALCLINKVCKDKDKGVRVLNFALSDIVSKISYLIANQIDDGTLGDLKISFRIDHLKYPVNITESMIYKLLPKNMDDFNTDSARMMYM